jgi:ribosomal-protein-alanine N-acetyltransferase
MTFHKYVCNYVIERAVESDIPEILKILDQWYMKPVMPSNDIPFPERSHIDVEKFFVARIAKKVVGVAGYIVNSDTEAETASLAVDKSHRGKGIGKALQIERMKKLWQIGIKTLRTETDRPETIAWYKKHFAYREVDRNPKKHDFSLPDVHEWMVLVCDLQDFFEKRRGKNNQFVLNEAKKNGKNKQPQ